MATDVVLFDLGGVLVQLDGVPVWQRWTGETDPRRLTDAWLACPWVRRYESGSCSRDEFARGMVEHWDLPVDERTFLAEFARWPKQLFAGAQDLVAGLHPELGRACLSNTNELHWSHQSVAFGLHDLFERHFLSHQMGLLKPDPDVFHHVLGELGCAGGRVLFLDDSETNVEAARREGIDAWRVEGADQARDLLRERGLLRP